MLIPAKVLWRGVPSVSRTTNSVISSARPHQNAEQPTVRRKVGSLSRQVPMHFHTTHGPTPRFHAEVVTSLWQQLGRPRFEAVYGIPHQHCGGHRIKISKFSCQRHMSVSQNPLVCMKCPWSCFKTEKRKTETNVCMMVPSRMGASTRAGCVEKHGLEHPPSPHHEFVTVFGVGPELLKFVFFSLSHIQCQTYFCKRSNQPIQQKARHLQCCTKHQYVISTS